MRRRVIQVAESTLLVSLPIKWARKYSITKGDELDLTIHNSSLVIESGKEEHVEKRSFVYPKGVKKVSRTFHAYYKKGVDTIDVDISDPVQIHSVQEAISRETLGYEIVDQSENSCRVHCITTSTEDFNRLLRRIFVVQLTVCDDSLEIVKKKEFDRLKQVKILTETSRRLTILCRRMINKKGYQEESVGPLYYIVEEMENISNEYERLIDYMVKCAGNVENGEQVLEIYFEVNKLMRNFYELYYKFDEKHISNVGKYKNDIIDKIYLEMEKGLGSCEVRVLTHLLIITRMIYGLLSPYLVLKL